MGIIASRGLGVTDGYGVASGYRACQGQHDGVMGGIDRNRIDGNSGAVVFDREGATGIDGIQGLGLGIVQGDDHV